MKRYTLALVTAALVGMISCRKDSSSTYLPCIPSDLAPHVLAFYPFANGSLNDVSGNVRHLSNTSTAAPGPSRNGTANCAYTFTNPYGLPEYEQLVLDNPDFLNGIGDFSVSLWYKAADTSRFVGRFEPLISRDRSQRCPDRNGEWSIGLYDCRKAVFSVGGRCS